MGDAPGLRKAPWTVAAEATSSPKARIAREARIVPCASRSEGHSPPSPLKFCHAFTRRSPVDLITDGIGRLPSHTIALWEVTKISGKFDINNMTKTKKAVIELIELNELDELDELLVTTL